MHVAVTEQSVSSLLLPNGFGAQTQFIRFGSKNPYPLNYLISFAWFFETGSLSSGWPGPFCVVEDDYTSSFPLPFVIESQVCTLSSWVKPSSVAVIVLTVSECSLSPVLIEVWAYHWATVSSCMHPLVYIHLVLTYLVGYWRYPHINGVTGCLLGLVCCLTPSCHVLNPNL